MDTISEDKFQTTPPEYDSPPEYDFQNASRQMFSGTAEATSMLRTHLWKGIADDTTDDGRVELNVDSKIAQVFAQLIEIPDEYILDPPPIYSPESQPPWTIPLNIVIQVVGSRGDVQPFVALGNELLKFGHRVRLATHDIFRTFVQNAGLEFFPIGGNPTELMAYMVRNPGLIPSMKTFREGEIKRKRKMIAEMLDGCWRSCIEPDPDTSVPFVANAIIANPPSFAHIHCAQALSIPLHLVFTMPWSPTRAFPHPLANIKNTTTDAKLANYLSYGLVQALTWQGLGDVINAFRNDLSLLEVPFTEGPFLADTLQVPHTYCWSPALVPKPKDWPDNIDVCGFIFRNPMPYTPSDDFTKFLEEGPPPIYIGFGSIVVERPGALLSTVLDAVKACGVRAIISKGWTELCSADMPEGVFFLGDCPHEWLFQHVTAVVHHGGAGTTAAGLICGRPTVVVPFFGDQPFWGDMIHSAKAGPRPIPHKSLTVPNLAEAITFCLTSEALEAAEGLAQRMKTENGAAAAVASFHRHLAVETICCDLIPKQPAVYNYVKKGIKLSSPAANALIGSDKIKFKHLDLHRSNIIHIENRRWDSVTGGASVALGMSYDMLMAGNNLWYGPYKIHKRSRETHVYDAGEGSSVMTTSSRASQSKHVANMAGASLMSIPRLFGVLLKGFIMDAPLAIAEGLRATPKLYGEAVKDHDPVTDWKSGFAVAGKDSSTLISTGLVDIFVQPCKGAKEDGVVGFAAGIGKGMSGTFTKTGAGRYLGMSEGCDELTHILQARLPLSHILLKVFTKVSMQRHTQVLGKLL